MIVRPNPEVDDEHFINSDGNSAWIFEQYKYSFDLEYFEWFEFLVSEMLGSAHTFEVFGVRFSTMFW